MKPPFSAGRRFLLLGLVFFFSGGCATLPATSPLLDREQQQMAAVFLQTMEERLACVCCLDARVDLTLRSFFKSGTITGFLQARSPSFLKFVGLNPLGQPMVMLVTDGDTFRSLVVPEGKAFAGPVTAAAFTRHAPAGFDPGHGFFWLTGSLPPRDLRIMEVRKDAGGQGYWLVAVRGGEEFRRHLLFDAEKRLLLRHIVLDGRGAVVMDVRYSGHQGVVAAGGGMCFLPGGIRVEAGGKPGGSVLEMTLDDWLPEAEFSAGDFTLVLPPGFVLTPVE